MSIPGFGDAVTLFDTSQRIITFINDLRHAQDDLMGLAAEAQTLRICINAVTSDSCHATLYTYISEKQGRDLRTIVNTCISNLDELTKFIADVAMLVEKKGRREGILTASVTRGARPGDVWRKRKSWTGRLRRAFAKCWAAYKFTMADKQAYRDKLVLPTQAVNIFLTSMTHVGIVHMGRSIGQGGGGSIPPQPQQSLLLPPPGAVTGGGTGPAGGRLGGWEIVGSQIAFKKPSFSLKGQTMAYDFEAEVLMYAKHLARGGERFSYVFEKQGRQFKVTKAPVDKTPKKPHSRSRSRSKSRPRQRGRDQLSLGRDAAGTFVKRRKSVAVPPSADSGSGLLGDLVDGRPRRPFLALPAPDYIEIQPSGWESDSDGGHSSHGNDDNEGPGGGGGGGGGSGRRPFGASHSDGESPPRHQADDEHRVDGPESLPTGAATSGPSRTRSRWHDNATYRNSKIQDLDGRKREIEARIQHEQDEAIRIAEQATEPERTRRRTALRHDTHMSEAEKDEIDEYYDLADTMRYLNETYGLIITPAGERPAVDNGEVHSDDEEVTYDPLLARTDRLKAETSMRPPTMFAEEEAAASSKRRKPDPSFSAAETLSSRMWSRTDPAYARQAFAEPLYASFTPSGPQGYQSHASRPRVFVPPQAGDRWSPIWSDEEDEIDSRREHRIRLRKEEDLHRQRYASARERHFDAEFDPRRYPSTRYDDPYRPLSRYAEFGPRPKHIIIDPSTSPPHPARRPSAPRRPSASYREKRPSYAADDIADVETAAEEADAELRRKRSRDKGRAERDILIVRRDEEERVDEELQPGRASGERRREQRRGPRRREGSLGLESETGGGGRYYMSGGRGARSLHDGDDDEDEDGKRTVH